METIDQFFEELEALGYEWRITGNMSGIIRTAGQAPCMCPILAVARAHGWKGTANHFSTMEMASFLTLDETDITALMHSADASTVWDDEEDCEVHQFDYDLRDRLLRATKIVEA